MKLAQRWRNFKRPASSKGMWKQFVEDNQWPLVAQSVIPEEWDELSPKEDLYYQQGPFSTNEVFLGSKGGTPQLVQPGPGRPGYNGDYPKFRFGGEEEFKKIIEQVTEEVAEKTSKGYGYIQGIRNKYVGQRKPGVKRTVQGDYLNKLITELTGDALDFDNPDLEKALDDYYSRETVKQGDLKKIIKKHKVSESAFLERIQTLGRNPVTVTASGKEKVPFTTKEKNQIKANFELPEGVKKWDFDNHKYGFEAMLRYQ